MSAAAPWMPLYVADYLADTEHLSALEHGVYLLLIMHYWRRGGLPTDDSTLAKIVRLSPREWSRIRPNIAALFFDDWRHKRIEKELEKSKEKRERRADAGSRGGHANALKNKNRTLANAAALLEQNPSNALASSSQPQPQSELHSDKKRAGRAFSLEFETEFWPAWPHKVGKSVAENAFASARKRASLDQIIGGVRAYIAAKPPDRPWLNPATFLKQDRFNDAPAPVSAPAHGLNGRPEKYDAQAAINEAARRIAARGSPP